MKFRSILLLSMAFAITIGATTYPKWYPFLKISFNLSEEGTHPKNVNLAAPDAINCPQPIVLTADANCMAQVIVQTPVSTCGNITFMSYTLPNGTTVTLTAPYPTQINLGNWSFGVYQLVWNVSDDCFPLPTSAICNQTIVIDDLPPSITCPDNVTVGNSEDGRRIGNRMMNFPVLVGQPTATDNCTPDDQIVLTNDYNDTDDASDDYPLGTTTVCWTATDLSGNTASCCMTVTVIDNTPPDITCPDTLNVQCDAPAPFQYYAQFLAAGGSATDETMLDTSTFMFVIDSISNMTCEHHKTIKRFYKIGDTNGNMDTCFQIINVNDNTPPIARCKNITVNLESNGMVTITAGQLNDGSTDNCSGALQFSSTHNLFFGCNDVAAGGKVNVVLIVTDVCGNSSTCMSTVMVMDQIPPTITCPGPITVNTNAGTCFATNVVLGTPSTMDNCLPMNAAVPTLSGVLVTGTTSFPAGTNTVIWTVTDGSNNTATCAQIVTVLDNQNPIITCPAPVAVNANAGVCYASNVSLGTPTTSDNCNVQGVTATFNGSAVSGATQFPVGNTNIVTWTVTDVNGRTSSCTQNVAVTDNQNPTITCPAAVAVNANNSQCYATNVPLGTPSTNDNCGVQSTVARFNGVTVTAGTQFPVGTSNVVTWTVTDINGRTASCTQNVTVTDNQLPSITCPAPVTVNTNPGLCYANNVILGNPVTSDNCPGQTSVPRLGSSIVVGTTQFAVGNNTVIWTVTDASNNIATCAQTVTVLDNQNPTISCPAAVSVNANAAVCYASNVSLGTPTTSDNCSVQSVTATFNGSAVSGTTQFPVGNTNIVTWLVTDVNGRTSSCTQNVSVTDNQNPTITCPAAVAVNANNGQCYATNVTLGTPSTSDNCGVQGTVARFNGVIVTAGTQFPVGTSNIVTWTVTDINGRTASCTQNVSVTDNQPPLVTCPAPQEAPLNNSCMLTVPDLRSLVIKSDNCGSTTISQSPLQGTTIASSHNQTHTFTFTVTDNAGLTATCSIIVTAKDLLGPDIVCKQPRILSISDEPEVAASSFVSSAIDNCGGTLTYTARRMGNVCGGTTPDDLGNYVNFCCADVNQTITIVIRVTDSRGNVTECMTSVVVSDKLAPTITTPLPDISISCEYPLNLNNLSAFGTFVAQGSTRNNIVIADPNNPFYPTGIAGKDGVYSENCPPASVSVTTRNLLGMCNTGQIKRDFVITDSGNNTAVFTQTIFVVDVDKFDVNDITWPAANVDYNDCNDADPDTSVTGSPILNTDHCNLVAATYADQTFAHPVYCKYIKRTWTVLDWCQYQSNTPGSPGKWTFIQNIYVKNNVAPVIGSKVCRDTVICTPNTSCVANVTFNATGSDDCNPVNIIWTYKIDLDNNGGAPDITGTGSTVTRTFNIGKHKLTWEAKDGCSNISTCSFLFTIKDCKAPNAVAMQGLAVNLAAPMGMATIWASDFNNFSSDNCTPTGQLKYSFSSNTSNTSRSFTCDSLGQRKIELWVTDLAGNQSKATTFISVQDNQHICNGDGRILIAGNVYTEDKIHISDTKVTIDGGETEGHLMTDKDGNFRFDNLTMYNDYQLLPVRDINHAEGVSTIDLVLIQRHILGLKHLDSPYKIIAADANNSESITAADLVELRKIVLGVQTEFTKNNSWRFVDAEFTFADTLHPWPFHEKLEYQSLETNMTQSDFIGVKIGDVNGSVSEKLRGKTENRSNGLLTFTMDNVTLKAGEMASIPVGIDEIDGLLGFQGTLEFAEGLSVVGFEAVSLPIKNDNIGHVTIKGKTYLTFSYDNVNGMSLTKGDIIMNLIVTSNQTTELNKLIKMSNAVTPSLAISSNYSELSTRLIFPTADSGIEKSSLSQNQPNPFKDETLIHLFNKEESPVSLSIFNAEGQSIYNANMTLPSGQQTISISEKQLGQRYGVFYCRVKTNQINEVVKMLRLE